MLQRRIQKLNITASTNDDAKAAAERGEAEGLVIWALKQTSGRGRQGRIWESPEGNLYCSVLLRPDAKPGDIGLYSFVAANAMYDTVRQCLPIADITLKWPNDVLVEGKKIGGILLEVAGDALIVGMGLNVMHHPENALYPATSLSSEMGLTLDRSDSLPLEGRVREGGHPLFPASGLRNAPSPNPSLKGRGVPPLPSLPDSLKLEVILDNLLMNIDHWYSVMKKDGFLPIRAFWLKRAAKGLLKVRLPEGQVEGDFAGLDETGRLILHLADGSEQAIATGDVFLEAGGQRLEAREK